MLKIFLSIIFNLFAFLLFSQTSVTEATVYKLFDKPDKIKWIKHYKGKIDQINDIAVSLAFDGKNCKGILRYLRSNENFFLVGKIKQDAIKLDEIDYNKQTSGFIYANFIENNIIGEWSNYNNTIGGKIFLEEIAEEIKTPSHCGKDKWLRVYSGVANNEEVEMILQKDMDKGVQGSIYFRSTQKTKLVKGILINDSFNLKISEINGDIYGALELEKAGERNKLMGNFINADGIKKAAPFRIVEEYNMDCLEFADYTTSYDFTFPKTKNEYFNKWIEGKIKTWAQSSRTYADQQKKINLPTPVSRTSLRAFGWTDVNLFNDRLFSGFLNYSKTWSNEEECIPFNFDRTQGKMLQLVDLFESDFDYKTFVQNFVNISIQQLQQGKADGYAEWIKKQEFPYFNIRNEGISFSTKFNPVFGQQHILVSYEKLKPYLKKDGPINFLVENIK